VEHRHGKRREDHDVTALAEHGLLRPEDVDPAPLLDGIVAWVEMETPSERPDLIEILLDRVGAEFADLPVERQRMPGRNGCGGQLVLSYAPAGVTGEPALLMGHVDTVWAAGTLAERPVHRNGDRIYGPGIFDMKAGSYLAAETLRRIAAQGLVPPRPIVVLLNSDEEIGSPTSRTLIEELSSRAAFVLVPEPAFGAAGTVVNSAQGLGPLHAESFRTPSPCGRQSRRWSQRHSRDRAPHSRDRGAERH
jgi:glutamate carboxypeptidase